MSSCYMLETHYEPSLSRATTKQSWQIGYGKYAVSTNLQLRWLTRWPSCCWRHQRTQGLLEDLLGSLYTAANTTQHKIPKLIQHESVMCKHYDADTCRVPSHPLNRETSKVLPNIYSKCDYARNSMSATSQQQLSLQYTARPPHLDRVTLSDKVDCLALQHTNSPHAYLCCSQHFT
jgi:hypothetical protein